MKFLKQIARNEKGQVLPLVLTLLVLMGLSVTPSLNYAATNLNSTRILERGVSSLYAADAGIEDTLWRIQNGSAPVAQLADTVNQMAVAINVQNMGVYTLYLGELIAADGHSEYLDITGDVVWDAGAGAYKYTITVIWQPGGGIPVIHFEELGVKLPVGYEYQTGSAALFGSNLSTGEPAAIQDPLGAYILTWDFNEPRPSVSNSNPVVMQVFYAVGEGETGDDYTWVVAAREDVGLVSEISGPLYRITATATNSVTNDAGVRIVADAILSDGEVYVVSWQVSR